MALSKGTRNLTVNMPEELYKEVKVYCATHDIKIKDYIIRLLQEDMKKSK